MRQTALRFQPANFSRLSWASTGLSTTARFAAWSATSAMRSFATAPSADEELDLVVIGAGPGGYVAAIKAAQLGLKTISVESRGRLGGTCLNVGCIPSKALLHVTHLYHTAAHDFKKFGIKADNVSMDVTEMLKYKDKQVTGLTSGIEFLYKKNGVGYEIGHGKVLGPNEVEVTDNDGNKKVLKTKNILLATGSGVADLPGIERDEKTIVSSTGALDIPEIPKTMAVIGGGVIGLEMGSVWSRLGTEVTVVEFNDAIAAGADDQIAKEFQKILKRQGMKFKMKTKVTSAVKSGDGVKLTIEPAKGGAAEEMNVDKVLVSVGRIPWTDKLGLESIGVETDRGRIPVDDHLRVTGHSNIYAIGDVVRGAMLAHKAEEEGVMVAEFIATGYGHVNYDAIPSVIYTYPEVAWVGKTEQEVKASGIKYKVGVFPMIANSRARTVDETPGLVKIIAEEETDRVLGAHIIASAAGEMIAELTMAIEYGASSEDVARTCHAHPTLMEAVKEAALATHSLPIHS